MVSGARRQKGLHVFGDGRGLDAAVDSALGGVDIQGEAERGVSGEDVMGMERKGGDQGEGDVVDQYVVAPRGRGRS